MEKEVRIKDLGMTTVDVIILMAEGNPGALSVMMDMIENSEAIDPINALGGMGNILSLDSHNIYGSRIWMFFKDVCGGDLNRMLGLMRAVQLGYLSESKLNHAIDNYGEGLDIPALLTRVKERLPEFVLPEAAA